MEFENIANDSKIFILVKITRGNISTFPFPMRQLGQADKSPGQFPAPVKQLNALQAK